MKWKVPNSFAITNNKQGQSSGGKNVVVNIDMQNDVVVSTENISLMNTMSEQSAFFFMSPSYKTFCIYS